MKNLGKGLLALLLGAGVVLAPGLGMFLNGGFNEEDVETSEEEKEGISKKVKQKIIKATIDIDPDKLNLKSKGKWITAYIEFPTEFALTDIKFDGIFLNDLISPEEKFYVIGDNDHDNIPDLMLKFERSVVQSYLEGLELCELTITGQLIDGKKFEGSCVIDILCF